MRSSVFAAVAVALVGNCHEFAAAFVPASPLSSASTVRPSPLTVNWMADTAVKKELKFDEKTGKVIESDADAEECQPNDEYCIIDDDGNKLRLTLAEKERIFLDSVQSFYASGKQILSEEDLDILKEDLEWNGSPVALINRQEANFLAATQAYLKGKPIMDDKEFDALKAELKDTGSEFAVDTNPKCYIDTGVCKVTMREDDFASNLLYLPALGTTTLVWLGLAFEVIEPFVRINPLILLALGVPLCTLASKTLTDDYIFQNNKVAYGPCPSCEVEQRVYFGDILGVEGHGDEAKVKCNAKKCKDIFIVKRSTLRASTIAK